MRDPGPLIRRVYGYVSYRIGPGPDAEDVTGEVFARAVRYRTAYDPSKGEAAAWVLGIARRVLADRGSPPVMLDDVPHDIADPEEEARLDQVLDAVVLRTAVSRLSERDRELIALRYGADLSMRQIAELTHATAHAVEVALGRALARLRVTLDDSPEGCEKNHPAPVLQQRP